ncbi:MAG: hypothetical protein U1A22_04605 [Xanthomonadaceae bacterium]|nr:hypothetical protein [Xanthomonadaceae bacterium]
MSGAGPANSAPSGDGRTLLLTGVPRGGTTLACRMLGQAADTVALFEPMSVDRLPADPDAACDAIREFATDARRSLLHDGTAPSKVQGGAVPDNPFGAPEPGVGQRRLLVERARLVLDRPPAPGFTLVIKHNAAFTALLPRLTSHWPGRVLALVRQPLAVLASWQTVPVPVADGRVPAGERFDLELAGALMREPDRLRRQLIILDWCFRRYVALPASAVLRYEDIIATGGQALYRAAGVVGPHHALDPRNANPLYRQLDLESLAEALRRHDGAWRQWYDNRSIDATLAELRATRGSADE